MNLGLDNPRFLAVIPARAGSKRIPRKNIRTFRGLPLIARTIQTVLSSGVFQDIIVSTDDREIAEVSREHGAWIPFTRPEELSDDYTPTAPVISHALEEVGRLRAPYDSVCCVYPGAVLMTGEDYRDSSLLVNEASARDAAVVAVVRYGHPIQRALRCSSDGGLTPVDLGFIAQRTQDLEPLWHDAGQFYWATPERWANPTPLLARVVPFEIPSWRVQDIDTEDDWYRAELIFDALAPAASSVKACGRTEL